MCVCVCFGAKIKFYALNPISAALKHIFTFILFFKEDFFHTNFLLFTVISFPVGYRCSLLRCILYFPKQFKSCRHLRASVHHSIFFDARCCFLEPDPTRACSVVDIRRQDELSIENGPFISVTVPRPSNGPHKRIRES